MRTFRGATNNPRSFKAAAPGQPFSKRTPPPRRLPAGVARRKLNGTFTNGPAADCGHDLNLVTYQVPGGSAAVCPRCGVVNYVSAD